eukprot:12553161-Ditylum_brightwellii.AAC.1
MTEKKEKSNSKVKEGESGWKRVGSKKVCEVKERCKTTEIVELDAEDHTNKQTVQDRIREHGELAFDEETGFQIKIQVEWIMDDK